MYFKFSLLTVIWIVLFIVSLCIGNYDISIKELIDVLLDKGDLASRNVVYMIRLPRILTASFCGGILGICGIYLQGLFKNPLVDPKIIGVSTGDAFGGCVAILFGFSGLVLIVFSFVFGIIALLMLFFIASFVKEFSIFTLILSGIIVNGFFGALISLTQYLADNEDTLPNIVFWLMGSFSGAGYEKLLLVLIVSSPLITVLMLMRWQLNLLSLDDKTLIASGVSVVRTRIFMLVIITVLIASQVSISGNIGWVGLVVPHMTRFLVGSNHLNNVPTSFVFGMIFMLVIDNFTRSLTSNEIPLSIICALVGTPLFAYLLRINKW